MSDWWVGSGLSWSEFLDAGALAGSSGPGLRMVERAIDRQTSELLGGAQQIKLAGFEIANRQSEQGAAIVSAIDRSTKDVIERLDDVTGLLDGGFADVLATLDGVQDTLNDLLKVARSPAQTAAYEQYSIAQEAYRRQLFPECLDALRLAIDGNGTHPGYKLDWRFHYLKGLVRLGSPTFVDHGSVDLKDAEQSFLLAARYAQGSSAAKAAVCMFAAGRAAFLQCPSNPLALQSAGHHLDEALKMRPQLFEAVYLRERVRAANGRSLQALSNLRPWILKDERLLVRACSEGEFVNGGSLNEYLDALAADLANELCLLSQKEIAKHSEDLKRFPEIATSKAVARLMTYANRANHGLLELLRYRRVIQAEDRNALAQEVAMAADRRFVARLETIDVEGVSIRHEVIWNEVKYTEQQKALFSSKMKTVTKTMRIPSYEVCATATRIKCLRAVLFDDRGQRRAETQSRGYLLSEPGQQLQHGKHLATVPVIASKATMGDSRIEVYEWLVTSYGTNLLWLPHVTIDFFNAVMPPNRAPSWLREYEAKVDQRINAFSIFRSSKLTDDGVDTPLGAHRSARRAGPYLRGPVGLTRRLPMVPGIAYVSIRGALAFCNALAERLGNSPVYDYDGRSHVAMHSGLFVPRLPTLDEVRHVGVYRFCEIDATKNLSSRGTPYRFGCGNEDIEKLKNCQTDSFLHPSHIWDETQKWQLNSWRLEHEPRSSLDVEGELTGGRAFRLVIELPGIQ